MRASHRFLGEHGAEGKVLAHVAQESDRVHLAEPVVVVDEEGAVRPRAEVEEALHLDLEPGRRRRDLILRTQRPLARLAAGVPDEPGPPADEDDGPVAGALDPAQHHESQEAPHVEAVRGGVEADIGPSARRHEMPIGLGGVGNVADEAPPLEIAE
jgi:hypothetical protein